MSENFITNKVWALKTVEDKDRALQTVDAYNDKNEETYNYDSKVANHKQIKEGDFTILIDKTKILGFAKINSITTQNTIKTIRKCPECGSSTIDKRKILIPVYRCNKGHAFDRPDEENVSVIKYSAHFSGNYITADKNYNNLGLLRPFYINNYNQNMSMQQLDLEALNLFTNIKLKLFAQKNQTLDPNDAENETLEESEYQKTDTDERESVYRQIKARRGQKIFRDNLIKRYGSICMITGCIILDILEAAHINPYRGPNDNHPSNGLLLRADIHTLFDLNLVAIQPETLEINFHSNVLIEYKEYHLKKLIVNTNIPENKALQDRWSIFHEKVANEKK